ncbi:glycosyltransferase family 25 protein [Pseudoalteromonas piscicida]|uniref:Glycosyl transferase n=1 Tax=Pseudoalteromonas piscicida TaxID=43662 RepID=A0A2A5JM18_PSEO7|nr:glycosyltransferase family 25 protein [Pseudoalteromonas piscicida]PCK30503.1 glycosyl transferase [Pseudoalteromonas piscicida]
MKKPHIFLINLDNCSQRLETSSIQFEQFSLDFERISAVHGAEVSDVVLSKSYSKEKNAKQYYRPLTSGEVGCYLSHLKVLEEIVSRALPYAFIFEDDFELVTDLRPIDKAISQLTFSWDMIKLFQSQSNKRTAIAQCKVTESLSLTIANKVPAGTVAQIVSLQGARKILAHARPFGRPIDIDYQHFWEMELSILLATPCPVTHADIFPSTIGRVKGSENGFSYFWRKQRLQINKYVQNQFHRRAMLNQYRPYF